MKLVSVGISGKVGTRQVTCMKITCMSLAQICRQTSTLHIDLEAMISK